MWIEATSGSGGGVTPTPITPSNTSPAAMTSGQAYQPSANGYAIESYDSVTPSSTPEQVASGDMVKVDGPGVIVDAVPPTPTPITPSNASPASLGANIPVEPTTNGWAIQSYSDITPGNPPLYMTQGNIYKAAAPGWAIDDYSDITPTSDGAYFASGIRRMMTSGYAYTEPPSSNNYSEVGRDVASGQTHTISGLTSGHKYLVLVFQYSSNSTLAYDRFDTATCTSGGTLSKISNLLTANAAVAGTFFNLAATGTSATISTATGAKNSRVVVFGTD